ncbi:MAG: helix-turn-helix domain-containing protein [Anaerolineales bacterium]|nr:helix-turn-helix domain-containing protein [Anaerolineales bacterium]
MPAISTAFFGTLLNNGHFSILVANPAERGTKMARRYKLNLSAEQVAELTDTRDHHAKPYVRERAAALLKVGAGQTIKQVAQSGLYKRRKEHTVKRWITRYLQEGVAGLLIKEGRGRQAAFSPPNGG